MFKAITANEFLTMFASEDDCNEYLFNIKWKDGYKCRKCAHTQHGKGRTPFHLRCRKCGYDESPTAGTLFHNLKFSLRKAFWLMFRMVHDKKGESTLTMGKQFGLNPKTTWRFMTRIRFAMAEDDIQFQIRKRQKEMRKLDGICITFASLASVKLSIVREQNISNNSDFMYLYSSCIGHGRASEQRGNPKTHPLKTCSSPMASITDSTGNFFDFAVM